MLAQESAQRRAPGFRPGTLLRTCWAGGAELAAPSAPLRHPAPRIYRKRAGPRTLPQGAPYGRRRSKPTVSLRLLLTIGSATRKPRRPLRGRGTQRPKAERAQMSEDLAFVHSQYRRDGRCFDLPPRCRRAERRGFSRDQRRWMSERSRRRSEFSAAREKPRSEGNPGPRSGPGSRQSGVFLGDFFARAKKSLGARWRVSAGQAADRRHVNTGCRTRTCHYEAGGEPKAP